MAQTAFHLVAADSLVAALLSTRLPDKCLAPTFKAWDGKENWKEHADPSDEWQTPEAQRLK